MADYIALHEETVWQADYLLCECSKGAKVSLNASKHLIKKTIFTYSLVNYTWLLILLVYLACPAVHIIDAVPVNLSLNHSLLRQTGDLRKKAICT